MTVDIVDSVSEVVTGELISIFSRVPFLYLRGNNLGKGKNPTPRTSYGIKSGICICNEHCYSQIIVVSIILTIQNMFSLK